MRGKLFVAVVVVMLSLLLGAAQVAGQQPRPAAAQTEGTPITPWAKDQILPRAAYSPVADRYLVVWEYAYLESDHDIHARQVGSDGTPIGDWRLGVATSGVYQSHPDVACHLTNGECLVVWEYELSASNRDIHAYRVNSSGGLVGIELSVATSADNERRPAVAYNALSHEYLVVYERHIVSDELDYYNIYGQRLAADGGLVGGPIAIAADVRDQQHAAVAVGSDYLVVWQMKQPADAGYGIYGQRLAGNGSQVGGPIGISTWEEDQFLPRLAYNSQSHNYLVVWEDHHWGPANGWDIYGQMVNDDGTLTGTHLPISGDGERSRTRPDVAYNPLNRSYLVVWAFDNGQWDHNVRMRRVAYDGTRPEEETVLVSGGPTEMQAVVTAGSAWGSKVLAVWEDYRDYLTQGVNIYGNVLTLTVPMLSGHVYSGNVNDISTPLVGVKVELYCSSGTGALGTRIGTAFTNAQGSYSHGVVGQCEVYHLLETDPEGYVSTDSTSPGGTKVNANQIYYGHPLVGKVLSDNNFWDAPQGEIDTLPPSNWTGFAPPGWVNSWTPDCSVQVEDGGSGLDPATAQYAFSLDGGATWHGLVAAACTGEAGTTDPQIITAANVPFYQDSGATNLNQVKFLIADVAGNPAESPAYPLQIDTVPPQNPNISCPQHPSGAWSANSQVTCTWSGASDDRSGVDGYSIDWDHVASTQPALPVETSATDVTIPLGDSSGWYLHVRAVDEAGNGAAGAAHYGPIQIDTSPPSAWLTAPSSVAQSWVAFDVVWTGSDGPSGVATYDVQTSPDGAVWSDWHMGVISETALFVGDRDQVVHFRVRARDRAGNVGEWSPARQTEIGVTVTVRVENENGAPLGGAEVFLNDSYGGSTFASGTMQLHHVLFQDELAARYLVDHHYANKAWHGWLYGSPGDWSYRTYQTSVDFGDAGDAQIDSVTNTGTTQVLRVRRDNTLVGFYALVSVEWDADEEFLSQLRAGFESASAYLYDLTDGQMLFEVIDIWDRRARWNDADYRIHASNQIRANADVGGIWGGQDKHVYTSRYEKDLSAIEHDWDDPQGFRTLVHEWGHYGLDLYDEYLNADGEVGGRCTTDREKMPFEWDRASFMDNPFKTTEMCSSLPLHPHSTNTMQHAENGGPCWDTVINRFDDEHSPPAWLLEQPPDRGSIMQGPTGIPVAGWVKTRVINADGGACPPIDTEWVYEHDGSPAVGFNTWVDRGGWQLYQGKTVFNPVKKAGVITILGARPGDTVRVSKVLAKVHSGSWIVQCPAAGAAALSAALQVAPDPFALEVRARPLADGTTIEVTVQPSAALAAAPEVTVWQAGAAVAVTPSMALDDGVYIGTAALDPALDPRGQVLARATDTENHEVVVLTAFAVERASDQELTWVKSDDGRMDLFLLAGSLPGEPTVSILPAPQMGQAQDRLAVVGGPYEVSVSSGVHNPAEPATVNIQYDPALVEGVNEAQLRIHHWDEVGGRWVSDGGAVDLERQIASTRVGRLGTFAVLAEVSLRIYLPLIVH